MAFFFLSYIHLSFPLRSHTLAGPGFSKLKRMERTVVVCCQPFYFEHMRRLTEEFISNTGTRPKRRSQQKQYFHSNMELWNAASCKNTARVKGFAVSVSHGFDTAPSETCCLQSRWWRELCSNFSQEANLTYQLSTDGSPSCQVRGQDHLWRCTAGEWKWRRCCDFNWWNQTCRNFCFQMLRREKNLESNKTRYEDCWTLANIQLQLFDLILSYRKFSGCLIIIICLFSPGLCHFKKKNKWISYCIISTRLHLS